MDHLWQCPLPPFLAIANESPLAMPPPPFADHTEHPDPNSSDAHVEVWIQQVKCCWRECPSIGDSASKLTADCQDLLDKVCGVGGG